MMYSVTSTAGYFVTKKFASINRYALKHRYIRSASPHCGKNLVLNVSGSKFHIKDSFLNDYPETLLGNCKQRKLFYDPNEKEYFIDRDPYLFRFVLKYYKTGKLHFPESECYEAFTDELNFFQINLTEISPCCREAYAIFLINKIECNTTEHSEKIIIAKESKLIKKEPTCRETCWDLTEKPHSSYLALVFYYISCIVIVLSIVVNCIETIDCPDDVCHTVIYKNNMTCVYHKKCGDLYQSVFFVLDTFSVMYFCLEYMLRLYGSPNRLKFITCKMGILDLLAILPYFIDLAMSHFMSEKSDSTKYVEMLRSFRIVRIFKFIRHSSRLKQLAKAITGSISELGFILFMYIIVVIVFASTIFYAEKAGRSKDDSVFGSIPEAIWYTIVTTTTLGSVYTIVTTTTLGYGDVVPETVQGKLIGSFCCLMGVIVIALPVPIIQMKSQTLVSGDI